MKTTGRVNGIISNIVIVKADGPVGQNEICYVWTGDTKMMAEVIKVIGDAAYVQVFDSTRGLKIGDKVEFEGHMLEVTLAPGLLSRNYDGLQNDLEKMDGLFIARGSITDPVDYDAEWEFSPLAKAGDKVTASSWLGEVKEQWVMHKIMVPFTMTDSYTVKSVAEAGKYKITDTMAVLTDAEGRDHTVTMVQKWPVKQAVRCYTEKPRPSRIMETGVRPIDTFNPMAEGGTGFIPGPFGAGKTVLQHAISKQADADVIIMVACGERANEVVEIFKEFPELIDPHTGHTLMERTNPTWPCTWFTPRCDGKSGSPFESAYSVMQNWGANHGAISYGHVGADLITLCSMLRIPVCMHNVADKDVFRPAAWNAFGMDKEGQDYRACAAYGPMYKNIR